MSLAEDEVFGRSSLDVDFSAVESRVNLVWICDLVFGKVSIEDIRQAICVSGVDVPLKEGAKPITDLVFVSPDARVFLKAALDEKGKSEKALHAETLLGVIVRLRKLSLTQLKTFVEAFVETEEMSISLHRAFARYEVFMADPQQSSDNLFDVLSACRDEMVWALLPWVEKEFETFDAFHDFLQFTCRLDK